MDWAKQNSLSLITVPGVSPDFSILESIAHPLKKKFRVKCIIIEKVGLAHFTQIFKKEMDQGTIQHIYNYYTKRLHNYRRASRQMTIY